MQALEQVAYDYHEIVLKHPEAHNSIAAYCGALVSGNAVFISSSRGFGSIDIGTVTRATKKFVIVNHYTKFNRTNGKEVGDKIGSQIIIPSGTVMDNFMNQKIRECINCLFTVPRFFNVLMDKLGHGEKKVLWRLLTKAEREGPSSQR